MPRRVLVRGMNDAQAEKEKDSSGAQQATGFQRGLLPRATDTRQAMASPNKPA